MPSRAVTTGYHGQNKNTGSGNNKTGVKGPRDPPRSKRDDSKTEEPASPSGPIIKAQITNTAKASSGKTFLDALRVGTSKRPTAVASTAVEQPTAAATAAAATAAVETKAAAVLEPEVTAAVEPAVETVAPELEAAPVVDPTQLMADKLQVIEQKPSTPLQQQQQQPVTLPETGGHFSWANDDDYSFVNQFTQPSPAEAEATSTDVPNYLVQYPQAVVDAQKKVGPSVLFKAPVDQETLASAVSLLEKERRDLDAVRHNFEEYRKKREMEMNDKHAQLLALERQLKEQGENLQQERSKLLEQQQQLLQQQQQQKQQPSPVHTALPTPPASAQHVPPPGINYTYAPSMQDNIQWAHPPRPDNWTLNHTMAAPPYEHNRYYGNASYQPPRGKPFGGRGGDAPPHMGRGNPMRPNPHAQANFNGRPMGAGDVRGPASSEGGVNPMFNQRSQVGYMHANNFHNHW